MEKIVFCCWKFALSSSALGAFVAASVETNRNIYFRSAPVVFIADFTLISIEHDNLLLTLFLRCQLLKKFHWFYKLIYEQLFQLLFVSHVVQWLAS